MIQSQDHKYTDGVDTLIGRLIYDGATAGPMPGVLLAPAFGGLGPFAIERATEVAKAGYAVLCVDYYGDGKFTENSDQAFAWMQELNDNRPVLARRMVAALKAIKSLALVSSDRIGAMGYCLGGKAVLDLARSGEKFEAGVTLHGVFDAPPEGSKTMQAALLILHGWDDPLATPADFTALAKELTTHCTDWQALAFGHTGHSFTNPKAQAPEQGNVFNQSAADRSLKALLGFFEERLGDGSNP